VYTGPAHAEAQADTASVAGKYRAPDECPDREAWRAALRAQTGAGRGSGVERLTVEIERSGQGAHKAYEGRIQDGAAIEAAAHRLTSGGRRVRGASCPEVFEALTLIARLGLVGAGAEPGVPAASAESAASAARGEASPAPSAWTLSAAEELALAKDPLPPGIDPAPDTESVHWSAAALALWGGAARATAGADLGLAFTASWDRGALQPLLLLGAYHGGERFGVSGSRAGARLERVALHAAACPLRFPRISAFGLRPCVDVDAGVVRGSGVSVDGARSHDAPWLSTGVQLRAEWSPWGPFELGAMIGGVVALSRPRFYFEPDTTAFQADAASLRAAATAGVSF